jgi:hypothetical protein
VKPALCLEQNEFNPYPMDIPEPIEFITKTPAYKDFEITQSNYSKIEQLSSFKQRIDFYCPGCGGSSVFVRGEDDYLPANNKKKSDLENESSSFISKLKLPNDFDLIKKSFEKVLFIDIRFACARNNSHFISFMFTVHESKICKTGQYPSTADFEIKDADKYDKILSKEKLKEFKRAIGLYSHGVGIGSFTYLRRIFEDQIYEAYDHSEVKNQVDQNRFNSLRFDEKIEKLRGDLPDFLVQNKSIYGILSKGIHELTEDDCLRYFDPVKVGIELILEEKLEKYVKQMKIKSIQGTINKIAKDIK